MAAPFVHLHLHTEYSLLDGACRIEKLAERIREIGQEAVAITDHGVMFGAVEFYKACKNNGIKPIIGCEVYVAPKSRLLKERVEESAYNHLILLCKNETGYKNLIKIVSDAYVNGFYVKPRTDYEVLREHSDGLIALSACMSGAIPRSILDGNIEKVRELTMLHVDIFGKENFYYELQNHGIEGQEKINDTLNMLSDEFGIGLVATNDAHYLRREDAEMQKVLTSIQTKSSLEFETDDFYVKSAEEMEALFGKYKNALSNTVKIADMCCFDFCFSQQFLPAFKTPNGEKAEDYFVYLCRSGLEKRLNELKSKEEDYKESEYTNRLEYEMNVIRSMGFAEYFLIVSDFVRFAKDRGIPVGPGRGSGAGSLCAYALSITDVDPIKYQLLFERFLNPERVSMPDIDIDFCYRRRNEVIDYVSEKYGNDHVAQIITFGTLAARAAIKDTGRVMEIPHKDVDAVSKLIPRRPGITIADALDESEELANLYRNDLKIRRMIDIARSLEGTPRHCSTHAAGVVITDAPVESYVPISMNGGVPVTQYTMNDIADLGLLKMDFLGLRFVTVIDDTVKQIRKTKGDFEIESIPLDDIETFNLLSRGESDGIFQLESPGMKNLLKRLQPDCLDDIIAAISLFRPGPMDSIPKFIANKRNPEKITYIDKRLESILKVTNGCIVYQGATRSSLKSTKAKHITL